MVFMAMDPKETVLIYKKKKYKITYENKKTWVISGPIHRTRGKKVGVMT